MFQASDENSLRALEALMNEFFDEEQLMTEKEKLVNGLFILLYCYLKNITF